MMNLKLSIKFPILVLSMVLVASAWTGPVLTITEVRFNPSVNTPRLTIYGTDVNNAEYNFHYDFPNGQVDDVAKMYMSIFLSAKTNGSKVEVKTETGASGEAIKYVFLKD